MEEKIKISLSKNTLETLKKDCIDFQLHKKDGTPNMNNFINTLVVNFYEQFSAYEENLHNDLKNAMAIVPDYYKEKVFNNVIKVLTKKSDEEDGKVSTTFSFKPTKLSAKALLHIEQVILKNESISSFYRRMFNAYARKNKTERERIIHKENYEILLKALKQGIKVCVLLDSDNVINGLSVYAIAPAKDELFNYVLGRTEKNNSTIRLSKIKTVTILPYTAIIPEDSKALLDRQLACAPQYPMFKSDNTPIKVELTGEGKRLFERIYLYRPTPIRIEGDVYVFNCSAGQALFYFERFGNNALIISPKRLGLQMRNYHYYALKKYNAFYKENPKGF